MSFKRDLMEFLHTLDVPWEIVSGTKHDKLFIGGKMVDGKLVGGKMVCVVSRGPSGRRDTLLVESRTRKVIAEQRDC